ncbi:hypothetical protein KCP69_17840 [Salmonella enterica subsp. enterica]|nr:hypothetical protein KCP69_17840 [Salmonella enterica subsp. enterica]
MAWDDDYATVVSVMKRRVIGTDTALERLLLQAAGRRRSRARVGGSPAGANARRRSPGNAWRAASITEVNGKGPLCVKSFCGASLPQLVVLSNLELSITVISA